MTNITDMDLYGILELDENCSIDEIKRAYRKKALKCHPDKNPDNPNAAQLFHQLSKALEILTDQAARTAYDNVIKAKKAAQRRHSKLDARRKKLKEDLEAREKAAQESSGSYRSYNEKTDEERLQAEIERLQKEGSKQLEEEQEYVMNQVRKEMGTFGGLREESSDVRLKVRWKAAKDDIENGGYDHETLHRILNKYGDIAALIVSAKKKGSALVEFKSPDAAKLAYELERGLVQNPLSLEKLNEKHSSSTRKESKFADTEKAGSIFPSVGECKEKPQSSDFLSFSSAPNVSSGVSDASCSDFESLVLRRMRQAEERRRLIKEMQEEDG